MKIRVGTSGLDEFNLWIVVGVVVGAIGGVVINEWRTRTLRQP